MRLALNLKKFRILRYLDHVKIKIRKSGYGEYHKITKPNILNLDKFWLE